MGAMKPADVVAYPLTYRGSDITPARMLAILNAVHWWVEARRLDSSREVARSEAELARVYLEMRAFPADVKVVGNPTVPEGVAELRHPDGRVDRIVNVGTVDGH